VLVTFKVLALLTFKELGTQRSSSASSCGRKRSGFRLPALGFRKPLPTADCRLPIADDSQEKNDMMILLLRDWLSCRLLLSFNA
jgi:hypothetical protein